MSGQFHGVGAAVLLALIGAFACKAGAGDRCICADDCKDGLVCLADGRVLTGGACSPAVGPDAEPGMCVEEASADEGDEGVPEPEIYLDLGSKRDFEPGIAPEPTGTDSGTGTTAGTGTGTTATTTTTTTTTTSTGGETEGSGTMGTGTGTGTGSSSSGG